MDKATLPQKQSAEIAAAEQAVNAAEDGVRDRKSELEQVISDSVELKAAGGVDPRIEKHRNEAQAKLTKAIENLAQARKTLARKKSAASDPRRAQLEHETANLRGEFIAGLETLIQHFETGIEMREKLQHIARAEYNVLQPFNIEAKKAGLDEIRARLYWNSGTLLGPLYDCDPRHIKTHRELVRRLRSLVCD